MQIVKRSYEGPRADEPCGQGRLFSRKAMQAMRWVLTPGRDHGRIDTRSLQRARLAKCRIVQVDLGEKALTIKSSAWAMLHSWKKFMAATRLVHHPDVANPEAWLKEHMPGALESVGRLRKGMK